MLYLAGVLRPPRPLFHNQYARLGERGMPHWLEDLGVADEHGTVLYADHDRNLLLIVVTGQGATTDVQSMMLASYAVEFGVSTATVTLGAASVTIPSSWRNRMVIVARDGTVRNVAINPGTARTAVLDFEIAMRGTAGQGALQYLLSFFGDAQTTRALESVLER